MSKSKIGSSKLLNKRKQVIEQWERENPIEEQGHDFYDSETLEDAFQALERIDLHFSQIRLLQQTNNSIVITAVNSQGEQIAIKMLDVRKTHTEPNLEKRAKLPKWMAREVLYHCYMDHPSIIKFRDTYFAPPFLCVEMEFASGGTLLQYLNKHKPISEDESRLWFQQLIYAVNYCHGIGIANRDIKLENCLLVTGENQRIPILKLADFGYAKHTNQEVESLHTSQVGTLPYYSPDVWNLNPGEAYDGRKCDVWSCGICLFVLLVGRYPFDPRLPPLELKRKVCQAEFSVPAHKVSTAAYDLLKKLLDPNPATRYSIAQIMKHEWFNSGLSLNPAIQEADKAVGADVNRRYQLIEHAKSVINYAIPNLLSTQDWNNIGRWNYLYRVFDPNTMVSPGSGDIPIEIDQEAYDNFMSNIVQQQTDL